MEDNNLSSQTTEEIKIDELAGVSREKSVALCVMRMVILLNSPLTS